jgi:hypothetical protein
VLWGSRECPCLAIKKWFAGVAAGVSAWRVHAEPVAQNGGDGCCEPSGPKE